MMKSLENFSKKVTAV